MGLFRPKYVFWFGQAHLSEFIFLIQAQISYPMQDVNTLWPKSKSEIFANKIKNNFSGYIFFKNYYIFYQNW
jgi:hypothetical protein